jgi:hypothetical protein
VSYYIGEKATRVYAPIGKRKDGKWSKREVIVAAFLDARDAHRWKPRHLPDRPLRLEPPDAE